jgi:rSAM/selenodomain-associated transferase 1
MGPHMGPNMGPNMGKAVSRRRRRPALAKAPRAVPFRCRLVIMAKAPIAGAAKTRLAAEIGVAEATRFARQASAALLVRLGQDPRWQTILAVSPDSYADSPIWPCTCVRRGQGRGDLGQRMQRQFAAHGRGPLIIVGTDIPALNRAHIATAFRLLGRCDAVFGPALDGGYWLVGLRRRPHLIRPFRRVRWSGPQALSDTLANVCGRAVGFLPRLGDVDSAAAYKICAHQLGRRLLPRS